MCATIVLPITHKSTARKYAIGIGIEKSIPIPMAIPMARWNDTNRDPHCSSFPSSCLGMHICVTNILLPAVLEKLQCLILICEKRGYND